MLTRSSTSEMLFALASQYGRPPMDVSHEGDIFTTRTLPWVRKKRSRYRP